MTMQGGYLDTGGFQNGLYSSLNYESNSVKLHHGHYADTSDNCYGGYGQAIAGSVNYGTRDPPSYTESTVFQNGFIPNSCASYYKMSGRPMDSIDYSLPRDGLLKHEVIDPQLTENVLNHRYDGEPTISELNEVPGTDHPVQQDTSPNLKLDDISEFKTDLTLHETLSPNTSSECMSSPVDIKGQESPIKSDETQQPETANIEEDKARGNSEVKPALSYIALIAKAILESTTKRLSLGSIYSWIEKNYPYYVNKGQGWRNSVRHNLSLNDCFIKAGRCEDGKGNYWAIHPANIQDFMRGDFRQRRRSRRRGRKKDCDLSMYHMANGYLGGASPLGHGVPFTPAPALSSIYSPYTEAERRAYRLDDALLRQNMNNPFMKWYHGNGNYSNQTAACNTGVYGGSSPQWQPAYTEQPAQSVYPLNAFASRYVI